MSVEVAFVGRGEDPQPHDRPGLAITPSIDATAPTITQVLVAAGGTPVALEGAPPPIAAISPLLDHLHDVAVRVEALPGDDLWVRFLPGLTATIPGDALVSCEAHTIGPPGAPRLQRPLILSVGGAGLSIRLPGSRWLRLLASVTIRRASLAPDGAVELHGSGPSTLDRAVGFGLRHASHHLSDLVRRHPQFARVRTFLAERIRDDS